MMLIPRNVFAIGALASRETMRYAIRGVRLERVGDDSIAVATDGRVMGRAIWNASELETEHPGIGELSALPVEGFDTVIGSDTWTDASKLIPKRVPHNKPALGYAVVDESSGNGTARIGATDGEQSRTLVSEQVDGNFPRWRDIVPDYSTKPGQDGEQAEAVEIGVSPTLLLEAVKALAKMTADGRHNVPIRMTVPADPLRPLVLSAISADRRIDAKVVVLPCKLIEGGAR